MDNRQKLSLTMAILFLAGILVFNFCPSGFMAQSHTSNTASDSTQSSTATDYSASHAQAVSSVRPANSAASVKTQSGVGTSIDWKYLAPTAKVVRSIPISGPQTANQAQALVRVGDRAYELTPNEVGQFDQINVAPKSTVSVQMAFPDSQPGDVVALEVEDGGSINGKGISKVMQLDGNSQLSFNFDVNQEEGIYRIAATRGGDTKMLAFWVSSEK